MKIMLLSTSLEETEDGTWFYPIGLAYLQAVLEKKGHSVACYDYYNTPWDKAKEKIIQNFKEENPDLVGFSILTCNRTSAFKAASILKKINPKVKIIAGDVHPTFLYNQVLENYPDVDYIVRGEGEITFSELAGALEHGMDIHKVEGIAFRENGKIVMTNPRPQIDNLDELPFPKHETFRKNIEKTGIAAILSSRGCPFRCQFCSSSYFWGLKYKFRTPKNVVDEMEYIAQKFPKCTHIHFYDDEFTLNQERAIDTAKEMVKRNLRLTWSCSARAPDISDEMAYWFKRAKCNRVGFGIESGSPKIIETIGKKITVQQVIDAFDILQKHKIPTKVFLMVGNPGEDDKTIKETISLVNRLKNAELKTVMKLQVFPNTALYELAKKQGFIDDSYWLTEKHVPIYTYEHSEAELIRMGNRIILRHWWNKGTWTFFKFVMEFIIQRPRTAVHYIRSTFSKK